MLVFGYVTQSDVSKKPVFALLDPKHACIYVPVRRVNIQIKGII